MRKLLFLLSIVSISSLCFADAKSDKVDISKIKIKNDMGGINATFDVKYTSVTRKLAPNKSITIYDVDSNKPKACKTNKFGEFVCKVDLYYDGEKMSVSFEPKKAQYKISEIIEENS